MHLKSGLVQSGALPTNFQAYAIIFGLQSIIHSILSVCWQNWNL